MRKELIIFNLGNFCGLETQVDTTFLKNEHYTQSEFSVRIHSSWQKKCRMSKGKDGGISQHSGGRNEPDGPIICG